MQTKTVPAAKPHRLVGDVVGKLRRVVFGRLSMHMLAFTVKIIAKTEKCLCEPIVLHSLHTLVTAERFELKTIRALNMHDANDSLKLYSLARSLYHLDHAREQQAIMTWCTSTCFANQSPFVHSLRGTFARAKSDLHVLHMHFQ